MFYKKKPCVHQNKACVKDKTEAIKPSSLRTTCAKCKVNMKNLMVCLPCRHISLCKGCCKEEDDVTCNVCQAKVFCRADLSTTLDSKTDCMVCTELRNKPSVLLPCRHTGLCLACANNIKVEFIFSTFFSVKIKTRSMK